MTPETPENPAKPAIKVLLDCRMLTWSGVGRYTAGLARALARRDDVELVLAQSRGQEPAVPGDESIQVITAVGSPFTIGGMRELGRIAREVPNDVTHCLHWPTPSPAPHPFVITLHDITPLAVPGVMPSRLNREIYKWMNRRAVKLADAIITPSEHTKRDLHHYMPKSRGKVTVMPYAADDFAKAHREPLTGVLERIASGPYIFSMGSTKTHKDLPALLQAFAKLASTHPDLLLLLAGTAERDYASMVLDGDPAAERVYFTGAIDDGTLRTLYTRAVAFVFPSLYEGFGLPPLEAMSLGTPVICSSAASLPEVVHDAAILVPAGDVNGFAREIARVLDDADLRADLAERGHARALQLTWDMTAEQTVAVYRKVLGLPAEG